MTLNFFQKMTRNIRKGFTLVEMVMVLGIFSLAMTLATSVLYRTQAINVELQEIQAALDNLNISSELMTRDIHYGTDFHCEATLADAEGTLWATLQLRKNCDYTTAHGGRFIIFRPVSAVNPKDRVAYYVDNDILYKREYVDDGVNPLSVKSYQITADDVKVKSLVFYVTGANTATADLGADITDGSGSPIHDFEQPLITLSLTGETIPGVNSASASSTKFVLQTSLSPRDVDNK